MRITDYPVLEEILDEYRDLRRSGHSRTESEQILIEHYYPELDCGSEDDALLFWVGLADAQYALKELSESVSQKAKSALDKLAKPEFEITPGDLERRRKRYSSPMPERKSFGQPRKFRCAWNIGDTFAYRIGGSRAHEMGIDGKFMLVRKVHELECYDGKIRPVVTMSIWDREEMPQNADEFASVPMLKIWGDYANKCKSGFLYRAQLLFSRKKQTEPFVFVGNFMDVAMPDDEIVVHDSIATPMADIRNLDNMSCLYWSLHQQYTAFIENNHTQ